MKNPLLITIMFFCISLLMSCDNTDSKYSKMIIGKYYSIEYIEDLDIDEDIPVSMTIESEEEFFQNGNSIEQGTLKFSIFNSEGSDIIIVYDLKPSTSKWEIKNSMLSYTFDNVDIPLEFKYTNASNYSEKEAVKYFREFIENDLTDMLKQFLIEEGEKPCKIIELNEKRLVTEDNDGEQTIQKRITNSNDDNDETNPEINSGDIYDIGTKIAEGVGTSIVAGLALVDAELTYDIETSNDKFSADGYTWSIIDVVIPIESEKLSNPKITFVLFLELEKSQGIVVGTVKNIKVDGSSEPSLEIMNNTMYIETEEGTEQVQMVDGELYFVDRNSIENSNSTGSSAAHDNNISIENFPLDFIEFINKFSSNSSFQLEHIKFPLSNFGLDKPAPSKDEWKFMSNNEIFEGSRKTQDNYEVVGRFEKEENNKISYSLGYPESDNIYYMIFEKLNQDWYLVEYLDENMNDF